MELSLYEHKILKYINCSSKKATVTSNMVSKKFGKSVEYALSNLKSCNCIEYDTELYTDDTITAELTTDVIHITSKGICYLKNKKLLFQISFLQRMISGAIGFVLGVITSAVAGMLVNHFISIIST